MKKETPEPYTTTPRYIATEVRNGRLTFTEWTVYQWLRIQADPYGTTHTSLETIRADVFHNGVGINYVNKLFLLLRNKSYIHYQPRGGRRGSFDVHFDDWLLPGGKIKRIPNSRHSSVRGEAMTEEIPTQEVGKRIASVSQSFSEQKMRLVKKFSVREASMEVRGSYNETDTETNINTLKEKSSKRVVLADFEPRGYEDEQCRDIALALGDEFINPTLALRQKYGFSLMKRAWGIFKDHEREGKRMENRAGYFTGIIKNLASQS